MATQPEKDLALTSKPNAGEALDRFIQEGLENGSLVVAAQMGPKSPGSAFLQRLFGGKRG